MHSWIHHARRKMGFYVQALILMLLAAKILLSFVGSVPQVPCFFIFGDSLMDNGNNNNLVTEAKANYPPYGIDLLDGPTGRFSNGRNIADVVAQLLGFENSIPPFATVKREEIVRGVNYASGAAGILDKTAEHLGGRISMNRQLTNHATTILRLVDLIGNGSLAQVRQYLNKCIYVVSMGNNDYINNYFYPQYYQTSSLYTPKQFAKILIKRYSKQLSKLYKYGARKFGISGVGYIGCTPAMMARFKTNTCVDAVNAAVIQFNTKLAYSLGDLESNLSGAKFIFINQPLGYSSGFNVTDIPCCNVLTTISEGQCVPNQIPCSVREDYFFWDGFHPTESISLVDGERTYEALSPFYSSEAKGSFPVSDADFISIF
ncbi:hypothetical protein L2E82_30661 [Cichorium intybus]|uniref:Uncharacterized protein n=1 Tax=Cichorium intybus TaxID=13427 RepID=A0ACB9D149_CICIN|nr:hypothetical protein L2E82_30661 [Cichorium intybus]